MLFNILKVITYCYLLSIPSYVEQTIPSGDVGRNMPRRDVSHTVSLNDRAQMRCVRRVLGLRQNV